MKSQIQVETEDAFPNSNKNTTLKLNYKLICNFRAPKNYDHQILVALMLD
jgi:hypothetical protein